MDVNPRNFEKLEDEMNVFELRIDGLPVWERIRMDVYREIKRQKGVGKAHTSIGNGVQDHINGFKSWAKNLFYRNPFLAEPAEVMFVGHPRRKKEDDGYWWDIYCDPIHQECSFDAIHFEEPYLLDHRQPARTENLRYLDLIELGGAIQRKLGLYKIEPSNGKRLKSIEQEIAEQFNAEVNLIDQVINTLRKRRSIRWLYEQLLQKVDPEVVVLVVSYNKETLIEVCKEKGIPVVELQHGIIHPFHFGYSFPGHRTKSTFPDYLFTFGNFWAENAEFPIPDNRVIPVGYPYLERRIKKYDDVGTKNQLVFLSQGTIGKQLSQFAVKASKSSAIDYNIIYKLHPGEYDRWRDEYPWLEDANLNVVDSSTPELYRIFAESSAQVGVNSTAIYEGLCFDLETYIFDVEGSDAIQKLEEANAAMKINSVDDLSTYLGNRNTDDFNRMHFFNHNSIRRFREAIERIRYTSTTYDKN